MGHRIMGRVQLARDRRLAPVCNWVWNSAGCTGWNGIPETQDQPRSLVKRGDLNTMERKGIYSVHHD